ncbi:MAG: FkbM family methyltransferase [Verrucomicrobiota bacterium]
MKNWLKKWIFGSRKPRRVWTGPMAGLCYELDPAWQTLFIVGLYECETYPWLNRFQRESRTFIDLGSGDGELVVWALKKEEAELAIAVEINPARNQTLNRNLALNGIAAGSHLRVIEQPIEVEGAADALTLEKLSKDCGDPIFLKIDIDGPEYDLLSGSPTFLKKHDVKLLIETHALDTERKLETFLQQLGYRTQVIRPAWWRMVIPEKRDLDHNQWMVAWRK